MFIFKIDNIIIKELGQHIIASGKFLMIVGLIRDLSELQDYTSYVSNLQ